MSLNVTIATLNYVICASDRRLTTPDGRIVTERANKLTCFECKDAKGFVTYNGIGFDQFRHSPSDWLASIDKLGLLDLDKFAEHIKGLAESKIAALPSVYVDRRHSFVIGAFLYPRGIPVINLISNYESLDNDTIERTASAAFRIEKIGLRQAHGKCVLVTGATDTVQRKRIKRLAALVELRRPVPRIRSAAVKLVRDAAYSKQRRGTVGTSVSHGILERTGRVATDVSVVGGTRLFEMPNFISPQSSIKDFHAYGGSLRSEFMPYDPKLRRSVIPEPACPSCGNPVPLGYERCGICDWSTR